MDMPEKLTKSGRLDGRLFNGGLRSGAGRQMSDFRIYVLKFLLESVVFKELSHGQIRRVKKTRLEALLGTLFKISMSNGHKHQVKAACMLLDRALGRPGKTVMTDAEPKPKRVFNLDRALKSYKLPEDPNTESEDIVPSVEDGKEEEIPSLAKIQKIVKNMRTIYDSPN